MEGYKSKVLDKAKLVIAIIMLSIGILSAVYAVIYTIMFNFWMNGGEEVSGLAFIFIIPMFVFGIIYIFIAIRGIKHYKKYKNVPLIERETDKKFSIAMIALNAILSCGVYTIIYTALIIVYYILSLIEAIKKDNLKKYLNNNQSSNISNLSDNQSMHNYSDTKNYCKYCGNKIDDKDSKFCAYCGNQINR